MKKRSAAALYPSIRIAPDRSAPPAGTQAVVADPVGATFGVWQPDLRRGAQVVNEPSAWSMSLLHTTDPSGAEAFYGELFGWRAEPFGMGDVEIMLWRLPGYLGEEPAQPVPRDVVAVMVPIADGADGPGPHWSLDFWIDDADAAAARTPGLGGTVVVPPYDVPGFRSAVLADPGGAAFSVSTLRAAGPQRPAMSIQRTSRPAGLRSPGGLEASGSRGVQRTGRRASWRAWATSLPVASQISKSSSW